MTDQDDTRNRFEESLRQAARRAYEAANGVVTEEPQEPGPSRWRWLLSGRLLASVLVIVAAVGALALWAPEALAGGGAVEAVPVPSGDGWAAGGGDDALGGGQTGDASEGGGAGGAPGGAEAADATPSAGASASPGDTVVVHVAGLVASPGVYELPEGSRVADAVAAAGGAIEGGDANALNLARVVADGERIEVLAPGAATSAQAGWSGGSGGGTGGAGQGGGAAGTINLNTADAAALEGLTGVGPVLASRIVAYRERNGPFASVEALDAVTGIGPALLQSIAQEATG